MALVAGVVGGLEAHQRDRMGESFLVVGWPATSSVGFHHIGGWVTIEITVI